jgi:hypothetical protein
MRVFVLFSLISLNVFGDDDMPNPSPFILSPRCRSIADSLFYSINFKTTNNALAFISVRLSSDKTMIGDHEMNERSKERVEYTEVHLILSEL